jgi:uncharacterized integral membrane protein
MGVIQPKSHPRFFENKENKTWFYVIIGIIIIALIIILIKL